MVQERPDLSSLVHFGGSREGWTKAVFRSAIQVHFGPVTTKLKKPLILPNVLQGAIPTPFDQQWDVVAI